MSTAELAHLFDQITKLSAEELAQLRDLLDNLPPEPPIAPDVLARMSEQEKQAEGTRRMLRAGIIRRVPSRDDARSFRDWEPIVVEGELLSEQIIRERR